MRRTTTRLSPLLLLALLPACAGPRGPGPVVRGPGPVVRGPGPVVRGPLPSRNPHPLALTLLHPRPRRARTQPAGTVGAGIELAYSSIHEIAGEPGELVHMDGEIARLSARLRYGLDERTDVEIEVAGAYATSGFLDHLITEFHRLTGLPNQSRGQFPEDQFRMRLRRNGRLVYDVREDEVNPADLPVTVTRLLRREDAHGPAVAVRAALELPSGDEDAGTGNGELDWAVGAVVERTLDRWSLFGGLDLLSPGDPDSFEEAEVGLREMVSVQAGTEYRASDHVSCLAQIVWTSPMTRDFEFEEIDREILHLSLGVAWDGPWGSTLHLALEEDVVAATGPDFGVRTGMTWGF